MRLTIAVAALCGFLLSCGKGDELDDLARAQKCLNEVDQATPQSAESCMQYVEKYSSQQANILKCSILMTAGGLVENKVVQAAKAAVDDNQTNKEAAYMVALSLDVPDVATGYSKAKAADPYCQSTGVPGFQYISGVIVAGTYLRKVAEAVPGGSAIDINDPNSIKTVVDNMLAECSANPPDNACTEDLATLGNTVATLANSYCASASADNEVCEDVNNAIESAGGNAANAGQALICYLNKKTFDPNTGACSP